MDGVSTTPSFEHDRRLRAGFVGCGDHSFRNVYPALRYLPEESRGTAHGDTIATAASVAAAPLVPPANIPIVQPATEGFLALAKKYSDALANGQVLAPAKSIEQGADAVEPEFRGFDFVPERVEELYGIRVVHLTQYIVS